ncbi:helix-turn-helix transcriptional regulator [Actinocorallia sp. API 0066]|uniref:helix-turn-helix domain-containing protein n=1 Tax=Actinocorallia sp. API 0066 TaxID=2896846 RepID=UPI001E3B536E|nr:helix-turn-helix transcriptional regulator [Actinocorallia sp. API 0066]MCD0450580.1 helix-turn-helix transcriptional regulator [Actinocorallia sp. API 0066]
MSTRAAEAKKDFGQRLRNLRIQAGLTGLELSGRTGLSNSKISRIESGTYGIRNSEIEAWCRACGAEDQIDDLKNARLEVERMWVEWREELRAGQRLLHQREDRLYDGTKLLAVYESKCVPGILQTHDYVYALFRTAEAMYGLPESEARAAAEARLPKQRLVTSGSSRNTYHFVIESWVLDLTFGAPEVLAEQLTFLLGVTTLPNVALGVIPAGPPRTVPPGEPFYLFDGLMVRSPMWSGGFRTSRPEELNTFKKAFTLLSDMAVYGDAARALIEAARARAQTSENP